jgi:hypothetical protein
VEILLCRGSAQKIETESGTPSPLKMPNISAPKTTIQFKFFPFLKIAFCDLKKALALGN